MNNLLFHLDPVQNNGRPVSPTTLADLLEADGGKILLLASDDTIVEVSDYIRVAHTSQCGQGIANYFFEWLTCKVAPKGTYALMSMLPSAITQERARRLASKRSIKRFDNEARSVACYFFEYYAEDPYFEAVYQSMCWREYLRTHC